MKLKTGEMVLVVTKDDLKRVLPVVLEVFQLEIKELVENLAIRHCSSKVQGGGEALSIILQKICFKNKNQIKFFNQEFIYSDVQNKVFHTALNIGNFDIQGLIDLLKLVPAFGIKNPTDIKCKLQTTNCCQECNHTSNYQNQDWNYECTNVNCSKKISYCIGFECVTCWNLIIQEKCGFQKFICALYFAKALRNFYSHYTDDKLEKFLQGHLLFDKQYPTITSWLSLSQNISSSYLDLLHVMCNGDVVESPITIKHRDEKKHHMDALLNSAVLKPELYIMDRPNCYRTKIDCPEKLYLEKYSVNGFLFSLPQICDEELLKIEIETISNQNCSRKEVKVHNVRELNSLMLIECNDRMTLLNKFKVYIEFGKDANTILVAKSDEIVVDSWKKSALSIKEGTGTVQLYTKGRLVLKERLQVEKRPFGFTLSIPNGENDVIFVQQKTSKEENWIPVKVEECILYREGSCTILRLQSLKECEQYDIQMLCYENEEKRRYVLLEALKEKVLKFNKFRHYTIPDENAKNKLSVFCHSNGEAFSPHFLINSEQFKKLQNSDFFSLSLNLGGGKYRDYLIGGCTKYLTDNFKEKMVIAFPRIESHNDNGSQSQMEALSCLFQQVFYCLKPQQPYAFIIVSGFDFKKAMNDVELPIDEFNLEHDSLGTGDNCLIIFDLELHMVLCIRICNGSKTCEIKSCIEGEVENDVKSLILLFKKFIGNNHFAICGIVAVPKLSRDELKEKLICEICHDNISRFLTKEDLTNENALASRFQDLREYLKKDCKEFGKGNWFVKVANQMMVLMAYEQRHLPPFVGDDDTKIKGILLTPTQNDIIHHPAMKKFIRGPFGSGKTIIGRSILNSLLKSISDTERNIVYFIGMDVHSLIQVEMEKYAEEIRNQSVEIQRGLQLECINILELTNDNGSNKILNLSECFEYLSTKHPKKKVHAVVEEFDSEKLETDLAKRFKKIMQSEPYKDSTTVVIVQSVQKERETNLGPSRAGNCFNETGAKVFELGETMRYTNKIHDIVNKAQIEVSREKCLLRITSADHSRDENKQHNVQENNNAQEEMKASSLLSFSQGTLSERGKSPYIGKSPELDDSSLYPALPAKRRKLNDTESCAFAANQINKDSSQRYSENIEENQELKECSTSNKSSLSEPALSSLPITRSISSPPFIHNQFDLDSISEHISTKSGGVEISTSFKFYHGAVCQHGIQGDLPKLIRVNPTVDSFRLVCHYLAKVCFTDKEKRGILLCNSLKYLKYLRKCLSTVDLKYEEYANAIKLLEPAPIEKKREVYENWVNGKYPVLLCDSSACRGLEYKKVILVIDESEYYKRHLLVESMCRSTSQLFILSFKSTDDNDKNGTIGNVENLVDSLILDKNVEDVTTTCQIKSDENDIPLVTHGELFDDVNRKTNIQGLNLNSTVEKYYVSAISDEEMKQDWSFKELQILLDQRKYEKFNELIFKRPSLAMKNGSCKDWTLLHEVCKRGISSCTKFLIESYNGCDVRKRESLNLSTPIHWAVRNNHLEIVKQLLSRDAGLKDDPYGDLSTPLHLAAHWKHQNMVKLLLSFQPDVNATDRYGRKADDLNKEEEINELIRSHRRQLTLMHHRRDERKQQYSNL